MSGVAKSTCGRSSQKIQETPHERREVEAMGRYSAESNVDSHQSQAIVRKQFSNRLGSAVEPGHLKFLVPGILAIFLGCQSRDLIQRQFRKGLSSFPGLNQSSLQ